MFGKKWRRGKYNVPRKEETLVYKYNYFLNYGFDGGEGNCDVDTNFPITKYSELAEMIKILNEKTGKKCVIRNYILLNKSLLGSVSSTG